MTCGDKTTFRTKSSVLGLLLLSKSCKAARPSRGSARTNLAYLLEEMCHQDTHEDMVELERSRNIKTKIKRSISNLKHLLTMNRRLKKQITLPIAKSKQESQVKEGNNATEGIPQSGFVSRSSEVERL